MHSEPVCIQSADAILAGTLLVPQGSGLCPAMLLISGSGAHDRDESVCGHTPFRVIAEHVASQGILVLRYDDRGVGESTGDAERQDFEGSVSDAIAAARWLARCQRADPARVVLLGHSEGGLVAAAAAKVAAAWRVVTLAGPATPIEAMLHTQAEAISLESGATSEQIAHERRMNEAVFHIARSERDDFEACCAIEALVRTSLKEWPGLMLDDAVLSESATAMARVVTAPAYRSLLRQDPTRLLQALHCPLLAIFGGKYSQVPGETNADACRVIIEGRRGSSVRLFPKLNHLFQRAETGAISEYERLAPGPEHEVLDTIVDWIKS